MYADRMARSKMYSGPANTGRYISLMPGKSSSASSTSRPASSRPPIVIRRHLPSAVREELRSFAEGNKRALTRKIERLGVPSRFVTQHFDCHFVLLMYSFCSLICVGRALDEFSSL